MPYKDAEQKRRWEREHREQRAAARRAQRVGMQTPHPSANAAKRVPVDNALLARAANVLRRKAQQLKDSRPGRDSKQKPKSLWAFVAGIAALVLTVGIGAVIGWVEIHPQD